MLQEELSEEYFAQVAYHLKQLKFQNGVLISVQLGRRMREPITPCVCPMRGKARV